MRLRDLDSYEPAASPPDEIPTALAHTLRGPPRQVVDELARLLELTDRGTSFARLSTCDRILSLAPRSKKERRNAEAWLVAFLRGEEVLLLTAPASAESMRQVHVFPEPCRRMVEQFGIIRSTALGLAGMVAPRAVESARQWLADAVRGDPFVPFFQLGNGDWDLFTDAGRVGYYLHEEARVAPLTESFGRWFELRYADLVA